MSDEPKTEWMAQLHAERRFNEDAALELGYALAKQLARARELGGDYGQLRLTQEMVHRVDKALRPLLEREVAKHQREIKKIDKLLADLERRS